MRIRNVLGIGLSLLLSALLIAGVIAVVRFIDVPVPRFDLPAGGIVDAFVGAICLAWFFVLLKAPWDLFFQARGVAEEMVRSREAGIRVDPAREAYVARLSRRLLALALSAHVASALLAAGAAAFGGGVVGWWFAAFYLVSTAFRPAVSAYRHLRDKLRTLFTEVRFPREDVLGMRESVQEHSHAVSSLQSEVTQLRRDLAEERTERQASARELREAQDSLARELERTVTRLTDNGDVVRGIRAFVRLVSSTSRP